MAGDAVFYILFLLVLHLLFFLLKGEKWTPLFVVAIDSVATNRKRKCRPLSLFRLRLFGSSTPVSNEKQSLWSLHDKKRSKIRKRALPDKETNTVLTKI